MQDDYVHLQVGGLAYAMNHQVMMMYTKFGLVLGGSAPGGPQDNRVNRIALNDDSSELDLQLQWELVMVPFSESNYSIAGQQVLDNFQDSHHILPSGRFSVSLPRKESEPVPLDELHLSASATFYLPVHGVAKKVRQLPK